MSTHDDAVEFTEQLLVQLGAVDGRDEELLARRAVRVPDVGDEIGHDVRRDAREVLDVLGVVQVVGGDEAVRAAGDVHQETVERAPLGRFRSRLLVADRRDDEHGLVERHERLAHGDRKCAHEHRHAFHRRVVPVRVVKLMDEFRCQPHAVVLRDDAQVLCARADVAAVERQALVDDLHPDRREQTLDVHDGTDVVVL